VSPVRALPVPLLAALAIAVSLAAPAAAQDSRSAPAATKPATKAKPCPQGNSCPKNAARTAQGKGRPAGVPPPTSAEQLAALPDAEPDQLAAADLVHYGKYVCDDRWEVFVERNRTRDGYVDVRYQKDVWVMKPVASRSGAVRLEDTRGSVLLVQIPSKSMLLNTQTGQRIVDSCQHDVQKEEVAAQARAESQRTASAPDPAPARADASVPLGE
jgi:hypothetical protein